MTSRATRRFWELFEALPPEVQRQTQKAHELFQQNPNHPSLRFKRVHATQPIYSVRINRDYRAVGVVREDTVIWFWIGSHDDYERLLREFEFGNM